MGELSNPREADLYHKEVADAQADAALHHPLHALDVEAQRQAEPLWQALIALLAVTPLPTAGGQHRIADVGEFMLMHISDDGSVGFKHRCSRNYVFLITDGYGYELYVPICREPFMRGDFDLSY